MADPVQRPTELDGHLTLSQASKITPGRPSTNCIWRWCRYGVLSRTGERVYLQHIRVGGKVFTRAEWIEDFGRTLAEADATMPQAHAHLRANVAHPDEERRREDMAVLGRHLDYCAALGVKNVVIHPGSGTGYTTPAEREALLRLNVENFTPLADRAGEGGMKIAVENMMDSRTGDVRGLGSVPEDLIELLDWVGSPAMGVTFDTSHANVRKLDIPAAIRELGSRLIATHISDNDGSGDQHRIPGHGKIDWPAVMTAFRDIGYTGILNLEIPGDKHTVPELLTSTCSE